ncbi:glycosyltransferase family 2 protein [Roseixanthobacter liquoris]|uniref:glycosyltransferase family 2 protein n=1 Tax=Roseixanthobacter liquoris TaxID=3119921 RepID=UPI0037268D21
MNDFNQNKNKVALRIGAPNFGLQDDSEFVGFSIDRVVNGDDFIIIAGWIMGCSACRVYSDGIATPPESPITYFDRPDVASGYKVSKDIVRGFLSVIKNPLVNEFKILVDIDSTVLGPYYFTSTENSNKNVLDDLIRDNFGRRGFLLRNLTDNIDVVSCLIKNTSRMSSNVLARGHLDFARGIVGVGGLLIGWAASEPAVRFFLVTDEGRVKNLQDAIRWHRQDVADAVGADLGGYGNNAAFMQAWNFPLSIGSKIRLIAATNEEMFEVASLDWSPAPVDPVSYAKWAFEFPIPPDKFFSRITDQDGFIIRHLISKKLEQRLETSIKSKSYGKEIQDPIVTIVIPIYGRYDFILNQMLEFSLDERLSQTAEIIYVIDDPRILDQIVRECPNFYAAFGVPFKIIWSGDNRGFAGATNLGASVARAPLILLLNSDVVPLSPGWLDKMVAAFSQIPNAGAIGARLLYPNGAIQHDGMEFEWDIGWGVYLNRHPGIGLQASVVEEELSICVAVTGACFLISKDLYWSVGGLDEKYMIGDFEDSDLCLKVRERGFQIGCLKSVLLVHLERQSLSRVGLESFRDKVVMYNAWQHQLRWGTVIDNLIAERNSEKDIVK